MSKWQSKWRSFLIKENKYEDKFFGSDIKSFTDGIDQIISRYEQRGASSDEIQTNDKLYREIQRYLQKYDNYNIGSGSFRSVFSFDDDYVVKVAYVHTTVTKQDNSGKLQALGQIPAAKTNQQEAEAFKKSDIFPRVLKINKYGFWMIQEKVDRVIENKEEFMSFFPNFFKLVKSLRAKYLQEDTDLELAYTLLRIFFDSLDHVRDITDLKDNFNLFSLDFIWAQWNQPRSLAQAQSPNSKGSQIKSKMQADKEASRRARFDKIRKADMDQADTLQQKTKPDTDDQATKVMESYRMLFENDQPTAPARPGNVDPYADTPDANPKPTEPDADKKDQWMHSLPEDDEKVMQAIRNIWQNYIEDEATKREGPPIPIAWDGIKATDEFLKQYSRNPDPLFSKIYDVSRTIGASMFDIRPHNVGEINGRFVILDSGLNLDKMAGTRKDSISIDRSKED